MRQETGAPAAKHDVSSRAVLLRQAHRPCSRGHAIYSFHHLRQSTIDAGYDFPLSIV
jgi:hypothetical protein